MAILKVEKGDNDGAGIDILIDDWGFKVAELEPHTTVSGEDLATAYNEREGHKARIAKLEEALKKIIAEDNWVTPDYIDDSSQRSYVLDLQTAISESKSLLS